MLRRVYKYQQRLNQIYESGNPIPGRNRRLSCFPRGPYVMAVNSTYSSLYLLSLSACLDHCPILDNWIENAVQTVWTNGSPLWPTSWHYVCFEGHLAIWTHAANNGKNVVCFDKWVNCLLVFQSTGRFHWHILA